MEGSLESRPLSYYALCILSFLALVGGSIAILIGINTEMPAYYSSATNSSYYAEIAAEALARKSWAAKVPIVRTAPAMAPAGPKMPSIWLPC